MKSFHGFPLLLMLACTAFLTACDNNNNNDAATPTPSPTIPPVFLGYRVEITNLTAGQIFSPIALVAHDDRYQAFTLGDVATNGIEILAEGGDNTEFLNEANASEGIRTTMSADSPTMPGITEVFVVSIEEDDVPGTLISIATMLINTNDAMTAALGLEVEDLQVGESLTVTTISYDSGTEANSEAPGTIPGPADGGEGFNAVRDDVMDIIRGHSGVVTVDDGLTGSTLNQLHRWDNPVARVTVSRIQ